MPVRNAQAGPSKPQPRPPTAIIDLTLDDDEEQVSLPTAAVSTVRGAQAGVLKSKYRPAGKSGDGKRAQSPISVASTLDSKIVEVKAAHTVGTGMSTKGKEKEVNHPGTTEARSEGSSKGTLTHHDGEERIGDTSRPGSSTDTHRKRPSTASTLPRSHPPWVQPPKAMQRQKSLAPPRPSHRPLGQASPAKPSTQQTIAETPRAATHQQRLSVPTATSRAILHHPPIEPRDKPSASSSRADARPHLDSTPRQSSSRPADAESSLQALKRKSADTHPTKQSSLDNWQKGSRELQEASASIRAPKMDTLSSMDDDHRRYVSANKRPPVPFSQHAKHVAQAGGDGVPSDTPKIGVKKGSSSTPRAEDGRSLKRAGSGFGSHGKPARSPHERPVGRMSGPAGFAMKRTHSSTSTGSGATPTPAAQQMPDARLGPSSTSKSWGVDRHIRPPSPLKQSSSLVIRESDGLDEEQEPDQSHVSTPASTPPHPRPGTSGNGHEAAVQSHPNHSPDYQAAMTKASGKQPQKRKPEPPAASETSGRSAPITGRNSRRRMRSASLQAPQQEETASRPKRARPAAGAYTVPGMDADKWPENRPQHMGPAKQSRRKRKAEELDTPKQAESVRQPTARRSMSIAPSIASSSTHVSSGSRPKRQTPPVATPSRSSLASAIHLTDSGGARNTATPVRPGVLSPFQPNYRLPTPATAKRGRMGTQTSTHGTPALKPGRAVTPSLRPTRPAELTPKTAQDGPDEEDEPRDADDFDPLAEFADYQFAPLSPVQSMISVRGSQSGTPAKKTMTAAPATPVSTAKMPEPSPSRRSVHRSGTAGARPASHPSVTASPHAPRLFGGAISNLAADILARTNAAAAKARDDEERKAAKRARLEEMTVERLEQAPKELNLAAVISVLPPNPPAEEEEESLVSRRSSRLQSASLKPGTTAAPKCKPISREVSKPRRPPSAGDAFFKEYKANTRKSGYETGFAASALDTISRSVSPSKGAAAEYPTPDSNDSLESISDGEGSVGEPELLDTALDMLENDGEMDGLLDVARELKDSKRNSARTSVVEEASVFWDTPRDLCTFGVSASSEAADGTMSIAGLEPLLDLASSVSAELVPVLAAAWARPHYDRSTSSTIGQGLLYAAVAERESARRSILQTRLLSTIEAAIENPFGSSEKLHDCICSIWRSLGAISGFSLPIDDQRPQDLTVVMGREEACSLVCQVMIASVKRGWLSSFLSRVPAISLVFLAVDLTTSSSLRRTLDDTIAALWVHSLSVGGSARSEADEAEYRDSKAIDLAKSLLDSAESMSLSMGVKTRVLAAIGQRNEESRSIARWYATGLLLSGSKQAIHETSEHRTPNISLLVEGAEVIRSAISTPTPAYEHVNDLITCLYTALSDIATLVQITPYSFIEGALHPVTDLRALIKSISDTMRPPGSYELRSLVSRMKGRLGQLGVVLEMQFDTAFKRMKNEKERAKLGPGLRQGKNGQSTLAFSRDTTVSVDTGV